VTGADWAVTTETARDFEWAIEIQQAVKIEVAMHLPFYNYLAHKHPFYAPINLERR
jgi:hypothetical protein